MKGTILAPGHRRREVGTMTIAPDDARRDAHLYQAMRDFVAHTDGVLPVQHGMMRHPDVTVIAETDMEVAGSVDPQALIAAIEVVSRSNPDNDWVSKVRDYPLLGIPVYAIFDPRTGSGAVLSDIHRTPEGPRYGTRKDFLYGEDVTIAEWTISTDGLPRYA